MTDPTRAAPTSWPVLPPVDQWRDSLTTVHMWTQIVGKVRLELAPPINHWWGAVLYVTTRGLTTSPIPAGKRSFAIDFDFVDHAVRITTSEGGVRSFALEPMSVADFFARTMGALHELNVAVERRPRLLPSAQTEEDFASIRDDPRFPA